MTFVTKLTLQSGDRAVLDSLAVDIETAAERKGADVRGPHPEPPRTFRVPLTKRLASDDDSGFDAWAYTVYTRTMEIAGHDEVALQITKETRFPASVHVEATIEKVSAPGRS